MNNIITANSTSHQILMTDKVKKMVKLGESNLPESRKMTYKQAFNYGMRKRTDLQKRLGFTVSVFCAFTEINGWEGYRISYCKSY